MDGHVRVRLDIAYDGSDFSGWAVQPDRRTVAGVLGEALARLFGLAGASGLTVAGRTDAGVHAAGQVCHVDVAIEAWQALADSSIERNTPAAGDPNVALLRRLARMLPTDVRVWAVRQVPAEFDARFSATYRRYEYRVADAAYGVDPLRRHQILAWPRPLDLSALNAAAAGLVGEHNFAAYCRRKENATTVREITRLDWRRDPDGVLVATVQADAFCQAMVRSLVGAMLAVGEGRRPVDWPAGLLALGERSSAVTVAPPHGLMLVAVGYPDDPAEYAHRAQATRRLRVWPESRGTDRPPAGEAERSSRSSGWKEEIADRPPAGEAERSSRSSGRRVEIADRPPVGEAEPSSRPSGRKEEVEDQL